MLGKKTLWVSHEAALSGATLCLLESIKILKQEGFLAYLVVPRWGTLSEEAQKLGIECYKVAFYPWTQGINQVKKSNLISRLKKKQRNNLATFKIIKLIRNIKLDYIVTNTITFNVAAKAAKISKTPHVWFVHEFGEEDHGFTIEGGMDKGRKLIAAFSDKVAVNSEIMAKFYRPYVPPEKLFIFYNPIPVSGKPKSSIPTTVFKFIMLGQVAPSKNQADAIEAMVQFHKMGIDCRLDIIGHVVNTAYKEQLDSIIAESKATDYITFKAPVTDVSAVLVKYDALLMCSRMEAFGRVTVEALKMGLPVIAADAGASSELITDGINGYLYESGNVASLTDALHKYKETAASFNGEKIAKAARAKFNEQIVAQQLKEIFS